MQKLQAYQHLLPGDSEKDYALSTPEAARVVALSAPKEAGTKWWWVNSYADLAKTTVRLEEDSPETPILAGETNIDKGLSREIDLPLKPLLCKVNLHSISANFSGRPYEGEPFICHTLYLSYAGVECHPLGEKKAVSWLNAGIPDSAAIARLPHPEMLLQNGCGEIGTQKRFPGRDFYCYPGSETCLVLGGRIGKDTCYYSIPLKGLENGQAMQLNVTLHRKGAPSPDGATESATAELESQLIPWEWEERQEVTFVLGEPGTRATLPDENLISDFNLFIFNAFGELEEHIFQSRREFILQEGGKAICQTRLLTTVPYTVLAAANLGYKLPIHHLEEAKSFRYHLSYPDEYSRGMPLVALVENRVLKEKQLHLDLQRLMARLDLRIDRRQLSPDARVKITEVQINRCPSSATLWPGSRVESTADVFPTGFRHRGSETDPLNRESGDGCSDSLPLYLLENTGGLPMQMQLKAEWHTENFHTEPGEEVSYSFPLETVHRNTVYPFTVVFSGTPEGNPPSEESPAPAPP